MSSKSIKACLVFITLLMSISAFGVTGQIDTSVRYQKLEGFGAANVWSGWTLVSLGNYDPNIYNVIFGDLGLDIVRLRNTYGYDMNYINNCQHAITRGRAYTGRPLKIMISSWSPEASLKNNGTTNNGGTLARDGSNNFRYADYANWWADSLAQYASQGMVADYINMQNEPDYNATWDSCRFEPNETENYPGYDIAFDSVYSEIFSRMGSSMPKMLVSDCAALSNADNYINDIENPAQVYGYSHHLYDCSDGGNSGCGTNPDLYIPAMTAFGSVYNDKPIIQTEYSDDTHVTTYEACMDLAVLIHNSLAVEGVSGYLYWQLAYGANTGLVSITSTSWTINPIYYAMKHYSAFTDPNWQRIEASADSENLRMTAFISPDNDQLSLIVINTSVELDEELDLSYFGNMEFKGGNAYRTSPAQNCVPIGEVDIFNPIELPRNSITTIVFSIGTRPVADAGEDKNVSTCSDDNVDVTLDGSGSYDDDGDTLDYFWRWNVNGTEYQANGISPVINLPVGEHIIELIVDDGFEESEPAYCTVNVLGPLKTMLWCNPGKLNGNNCRGKLKVVIPMPKYISKDDVDCSEPLLLMPGEIESSRQFAYSFGCPWKKNTYIYAEFDQSLCSEQLKAGLNQIHVTGQLKTGQCFEACGYIWFTPKKQYKWCWPWPPFWQFGCRK